MSKNALKPNAKPSRTGKLSKKVSSLFPFSNEMSKMLLIQNLRFYTFMFFLALIYIANQNAAVKTIRNIGKAREELKSISWENNSIKSQLMYNCMQSQISDKVQSLGLQPLETAPHKVEKKD